MEVTSQKSRLNGEITVPPSKSHTIRAVIIGALADGESVINEPLNSLDTRSAASAVRAFGAIVDMRHDSWSIHGVGGKPRIPDDIIDVGNSGTTLYMIMGTASLVDGWSVLTGDEQIRRRTAAPLIEELELFIDSLEEEINYTDVYPNQTKSAYYGAPAVSKELMERAFTLYPDFR
ncbi:unnamed protein product, partial [marine sediment metagenome]